MDYHTDLHGRRWWPDNSVECPKCGKKYGNRELYAYFDSRDYATEFTFECEGCENKLAIEVEMRPDFALVMPRQPRKAEKVGQGR